MNLGIEDMSSLRVVSNEEWCIPVLENKKLVLKIKENDTYGDRTTTVIISDIQDTSIKVSFNVTQLQNDALLVDSTLFKVPEEGGKIQIKVQSNIGCKYEIPAEATWVRPNTAAKTRGLVASTIDLIVDKNNSGDERQTTVKVTDSNQGHVSEIKIFQELTPYLEVDSTGFTFYEDGGKFEVPVNTNIIVKVASDSEWIEVKDTIGCGELNFVQLFNVLPMKGNQTREGIISFTDSLGKWNFAKHIKIVQKKSLYFTSQDTTLYVGQEFNIAYVNNTNEALTWNTSDKSVAKVDNKGHVTVVGDGKAIITATSSDGKYKEQLTLTAMFAISFAKKDTTLYVGQGFDVEYVNNTKMSLAWESSDKSVATVDEFGHVNCVGGGKAIITAKTSDGKFEAQLTVTSIDIAKMFDSYCVVKYGTIRIDGSDFDCTFAHGVFTNNSDRTVNLTKCTFYRSGNRYKVVQINENIKPDYWKSVYATNVPSGSTFTCVFEFVYDNVTFTVGKP